MQINKTRSQALNEALSQPNGARFYRCALQVNPFAYHGRHAKKTVFNNEDDYNAAIIEACRANHVEAIAIRSVGSARPYCSLAEWRQKLPRTAGLRAQARGRRHCSACRCGQRIACDARRSTSNERVEVSGLARLRTPRSGCRCSAKRAGDSGEQGCRASAGAARRYHQCLRREQPGGSGRSPVDLLYQDVRSFS